jgi:hypothetical protein
MHIAVVHAPILVEDDSSKKNKKNGITVYTETFPKC